DSLTILIVERPAEERPARLKLPVLPAGTAQVPVEVYSVSDRGHQRKGVTRAPVSVDVFGDHAVCVATGIRRIIPCAIVVDRPIHKLQMAVAPYAVLIEIVRQAHLANVELEPPFRKLSGEGERRALVFDELTGEADGLVQLDARHVRLGAKAGIAHNV